MPTLEFEILGYILYITSHDCEEPFHIHLKASKDYKNKNLSSSKLWIGETFDTEIANNNANIPIRTLTKIQTIIKSDKTIQDAIKDLWCSLFDLTNDEIDYYKNIKQIINNTSRTNKVIRHRR